MDHFSNYLGRNLGFGFFTGPQPQLYNMFDKLLLKIKTQFNHNFSIIHDQQSTIPPIENSHITSCSIAASNLIGTIATDKIYCVLFDSGSSKTLIHKHAVLCNYISIHFDDDLQIFHSPDPLSPPTSLPYRKFDFQNSTAIWSSMSTLHLLLTPWVFVMTSSLVLTS